MAGAPKLGKSWLGLGLRIAVAGGGHALGKIAVTQGDVLYLALEDNARRLRRSASAPARRRLRS
jgi:RecA-family ATPase